ncbi:LysR family transcriptional regulator [Clostridium sediminicola]|uniref:winged helix-turn-helix domain-containing protein n=1 Tax=Clostridium sediminicola TaxID=3114879 RepID=UPI0031F23D94
MELGWKVWIKDNESKIFGKGPRSLLVKVEELGSLRKAAIAMNMSYSKAWNLISKMEDVLGFTVLEKQIGGVSGGGSTLTKEAKDLMKKFNNFEFEAQKTLEKIYKKYF